MLQYSKQSSRRPITCKSLRSILPWTGQFGGGTRSLISQAGSDGITVNCFIRSTDTILFSIKQLIYMAQNSTPFRDNPYERDKPTFSAGYRINDRSIFLHNYIYILQKRKNKKVKFRWSERI